MTSSQNGSTGERKYHDTNAAYALPNDDTEHTRLETQAERIRELMNDQVVHAPLSTLRVQKALDIGCGTGTVTDRIASQFPDAQVYGLDLSPVPNIREKLQNIEYVQADFNEVTGPTEPDARFKKGSFDYIFSRLLVLGMTDWKGYIGRCIGLAKPGGWIEMHDLDITLHRVPNPLAPSDRAALSPHSITLSELQANSHPADAMVAAEDWVTTLHRLCATKGLDANSGKQLPQWFAEAGLEDVQIKRYMYPMGMWEGMTESEKKFAEHHRHGMGAHMPEAIRKLGQGQDEVSEESMQKAVGQLKKVCDEWDHYRGFVLFYAVCGKKPAKW